MRCGSATFSTSRMWRSSRLSLLEFQPTFLDILPLYILLLVVFPLILLGLRREAAIVLVPSFLLYAFVQITSFSMPAYPEVTSGISILSPGNFCLPRVPRWVCIAVASGRGRVGSASFCRLREVIAAAGFAIKISWTIHGVWDPFPGLLLRELWPVNKSNCRRSGSSPSSPWLSSSPRWCPATQSFFARRPPNRWFSAASNRSRFSASESYFPRSGTSCSRNTILQSPCSLPLIL